MAEQFYNPAVEPYFQLGPLTLTDAARQQAAAGTLNPWLRIDPAGVSGSIPTLMKNVPQAVTNAVDATANYGLDLATPRPGDLGVVSNLKAGAGYAIAAPAMGIQAAGNFMAPLLKSSVDAVTKTNWERQSEKDFAQAQQYNDAYQKELANATSLRDVSGLLLGGGESPSGASQSFDIGAAPQAIGGYTLPPPPGPTDYSGVQQALDNTKPQDPSAEVADRRKGAILTGMIGGLLNASLQSDANFSSILGGLGQGVLQGMGVAAEDKQKSDEKFKSAMNDYWMRTAGVRRDQAESEAQYANRVWDTKVKQLAINADAAQARAQAGQSKLHQLGADLWVEETVNGRRSMRKLNLEPMNHFAGMEKRVAYFLGGTEDAKKKAQSIVAEAASRQDPTYALPMLTLSRLKDNGKLLDLISTISAKSPEFLKQYNSIGQELVGGSFANEKELTDTVSRRRDGLLMEFMLQDRGLRNLAMTYAGLNPASLGDK